MSPEWGRVADALRRQVELDVAAVLEARQGRVEISEAFLGGPSRLSVIVNGRRVASAPLSALSGRALRVLRMRGLDAPTP